MTASSLRLRSCGANLQFLQKWQLQLVLLLLCGEPFLLLMLIRPVPSSMRLHPFPGLQFFMLPSTSALCPVTRHSLETTLPLLLTLIACHLSQLLLFPFAILGLVLEEWPRFNCKFPPRTCAICYMTTLAIWCLCPETISRLIWVPYRRIFSILWTSTSSDVSPHTNTCALFRR